MLFLQALTTGFAAYSIIIFHYFISLSFCTELYSSDDDLTIASPTSLNTTLHLAEKDYLVEFYHSYCGHCIHFAPLFKQFATSIKNWKPFLEVIVYDCMSAVNREICSAANVHAFPTLKYYPKGNLKGCESPYEATRQVNDLKNDLLRLMLENSPEPVFHPIEDKTVWHLKNLPSNFLLLSGVTPHKALQLILHYGRNRLSVPLLWSNATSSSSKLNRVEMVVLKGEIKMSVSEDFIDVGALVAAEPFLLSNTSSNSSHPLVAVEGALNAWKLIKLETTGKLAASHSANPLDVAVPEANVREKQNVTSRNITFKLTRSEPVHLVDIYSTLTRVLYLEVSLENKIEGPALVSLRNFINMLMKYLPSPPAVTNSLQLISISLDNKETLTKEQWNVIMVRSQFPRVDDEWVTCLGSQSYFRRYPCGLWTLFHVLTISEFLQADADVVGHNSPQVLLIMKSFITHFFTCLECRQNFQREANRLEEEVQDVRSSVLWLWHTHNRVNMRLHGDESEDPAHPKLPFPTQEDCPECGKERGWREEAVLNFLVARYRFSGWVVDGRWKSWFVQNDAAPLKLEPFNAAKVVLDEQPTENEEEVEDSKGNAAVVEAEQQESQDTPHGVHEPHSEVISYLLFSIACTSVVIVAYCLIRTRCRRNAFCKRTGYRFHWNSLHLV